MVYTHTHTEKRMIVCKVLKLIRILGVNKDVKMAIDNLKSVVLFDLASVEQTKNFFDQTRLMITSDDDINLAFPIQKENLDVDNCD